MDNHITRVPSEIDAITVTAESGQDSPVLTLNLNRYTVAAGYPNGDEYQTYMAQLEESAGRPGGRQGPLAYTGGGPTGRLRA